MRLRNRGSLLPPSGSRSSLSSQPSPRLGCGLLEVVRRQLRLGRRALGQGETEQGLGPGELETAGQLLGLDARALGKDQYRRTETGQKERTEALEKEVKPVRLSVLFLTSFRRRSYSRISAASRSDEGGQFDGK